MKVRAARFRHFAKKVGQADLRVAVALLFETHDFFIESNGFPSAAAICGKGGTAANGLYGLGYSSLSEARWEGRGAA